MMLQARRMNTKIATTSRYDHFQHEEAVVDGQGWSVMSFIASDAY